MTLPASDSRRHRHGLGDPNDVLPDKSARYREALLAKLAEEAGELAVADGAGVLDELADGYEVLRALSEQAGLALASRGPVEPGPLR